jgi:hypothetical protein
MMDFPVLAGSTEVFVSTIVPTTLSSASSNIN